MLLRLGVPGTATLLGLAGLVPFCLAPVSMWANPAQIPLLAELLAYYSLAIICFLAGIWWGLALVRRYAFPLLLSNALVLVAFGSLSFFSYPLFFLACAALLCLTVLMERRHPLFRSQPRYYATLRLGLSGVAAIALVSAALLTRTLT